MIDRKKLVNRHNPVLDRIDYLSPLTLGNGEFAFTADVTGLQTLYDEYLANHNPLCTMSQWGWHTKPLDATGKEYALSDIDMTEYDFTGRKVYYAVDRKPGNEEVYDWLRTNPHRMNLARIGLLYEGEYPSAENITDIFQELDMYTGTLESRFRLNGYSCITTTAVDSDSDTLAVRMISEGVKDKKIDIILQMSYGSPDSAGADFSHPELHSSEVWQVSDMEYIIKRHLDKDEYFIAVSLEGGLVLNRTNEHKFVISTEEATDTIAFTIKFFVLPKKSKCILGETSEETSEMISEENFEEVIKNAGGCNRNTVDEVIRNAGRYWYNFWETGAAVELYKSLDKRGFELERRIILSQYLLGVQCCGSLPPQETGLTCNSWYGKFHLEMTIWHQAQFPVWNRRTLLERSFQWYKAHLGEARENAARNGYAGARWPKMISYQAIDSPSPIAPLLIWQQPHILWLLWLSYRNEEDTDQLKEFEELIYETAGFMTDYTVLNEKTGCFDLCPPLIPAQESHDPCITKNPTYELEYWRYGINIAISMLERLNHHVPEKWYKVADNMALPTINRGLYMAHENCPDTFEAYAKDHPSMLLAYGLLPGDRMDPKKVEATLDKVLEVWDYATMWGWDFALMAMTATRLGKPEQAIDILLTDTPKNSYVKSGNNNQALRTDLPLYLPGNGSLLLAVAMMIAGYEGCNEEMPGIPKNGLWTVEYEGLYSII